MFVKALLVLGGMLAGVLSVWMVETFILPPDLTGLMQWFAGALVGGMLCFMLMFEFTTSVVGIVQRFHRRPAPKTNPMIDLPPENPSKKEVIQAEAVKVDEPEYEDEFDALMQDPDSWKKNWRKKKTDD